MLPFSLGYGVDEAWIDFQSHKVETIAPTKSLPGATLKILLSEDFPDCGTKNCIVVFSANALSSSTDLSRLSIKIPDSCKNESDPNDPTGKTVCTSAPFTLSATKESVSVNYIVQVGTVKNSVAQAQFSFTLDTTQPKVASIKTGYCEGDTCFAAANVPTPITITFTDATSAFEYQLVFVGRDGASSLATITDCAGLECKGTITVACTERQELSLQLKSVAGVESREDAQNIALKGSAQKVVCSTKAPEILSWKTPIADGIGGKPVSGGSIVYEAEVRSYIGTPTAFVNTTNVTEVLGTSATCVPATSTQDDTVFVCTWQLQDLLPGKNIPLSFKIYDAVQNYRTKDILLSEILNLTMPGSGGVDFFNVNFKSIAPERMNRMAVELARDNLLPYPSYVTYEIVPKKNGYRIIHQELQRCWYKLKNQINYTDEYNLFSFGGQRAESRVYLPSQGHEKPNRLDLQIRADIDTLALADVFQAKCQLGFVVAQGNNVFSVMDEANMSFDITLRETALGSPSQAFLEKIADTEKEINGSKGETVRKLEEYRLKADQICQGFETLAQVDTVISALDVVATGLFNTGYLSGAGSAIDGITSSILPGTDGLMNGLWQGNPASGQEPSKILKKLEELGILASNNALVGGGGVVKKVCRMINCKPYAESQEEGTDAGSVSSQSWGSYMSSQVTANMNAADPKTLVGAVSTMCVGGIIYSLNKDLVIDCAYIQCLKEQSVRGGNVATCDLSRGFRKCMQVMSEVGELPLVRIVTNVAENLNGMIQTLPYVILEKVIYEVCADSFGTGGEASCSSKTGDWQCSLCQIARALFGTIDSLRQNKALEGLRDAGASEAGLRTCENALAPFDPTEHRRSTSDTLMTAGRKLSEQRDAERRNNGDWNTYPRVYEEGSTGADYDIQYFDSGQYAGQFGLEIPAGTQCSGCDVYYVDGVYYEVHSSNEEIDIAIQHRYPQANIEQNIRVTPDGNYYAVRTTDADGKTIRVDYVRIEDDKSVDDALERARAIERENEALHDSGLDGNANRNANAAFRAYASCTQSCDDEKAAMNAKGVQCEGDVCQSGCPTGGATGACSKTFDKSDAQAGLQRQRNEEIANAAGTFATYAFQWLIDHGYLEKLNQAVWYRIPGYSELIETSDKWLNPERVKENICNKQFTLNENDEGQVFATTGPLVANAVATFGAEIRLIENESGEAYAYVAVAYVTNPSKNGKNAISIVLRDKESCLTNNCPDEYSLTNGAKFLLVNGTSFANGNVPKTKIIYLKGKYKKLCLKFDNPYPTSEDEKLYCRPIKEEVFDTGSLPPQATDNTPGSTGGSGGNNGNGGNDPTEGWG